MRSPAWELVCCDNMVQGNPLGVDENKHSRNGANEPGPGQDVGSQEPGVQQGASSVPSVMDDLVQRRNPLQMFPFGFTPLCLVQSVSQQLSVGKRSFPRDSPHLFSHLCAFSPRQDFLNCYFAFYFYLFTRKMFPRSRSEIPMCTTPPSIHATPPPCTQHPPM